MRKPPQTLDGADVVSFAVIASEQNLTGKTVHTVHGRRLSEFAALAICRYRDDSSLYLFRCDAEWNILTDTLHNSIDEAKAQAEFEVAGIGNSWITSVA